MAFSFYYSHLKTNSLTRESAFEVLKELEILKDQNYLICNHSMVIHRDRSKSTGVRYFCKICKKYLDVRIFTPFSSFRVKIVDILRIILLFTESNSNEIILRETGLAKTTITKVLTLVRMRILNFIESTVSP